MISIQDVVYEYIRRDDEEQVVGVELAVDHLSFEINKGEFIAVLVHNGSGKSTLAKLINAILVPGEGCIEVDGIDTRKPEMVWEIRQRAGMVFQNPDNQIVHNIVEEDVGFWPENLGVPTAEIWERVNDSLKKVGMYEHRKESPNNLSGGQKQRVAIARAMVNNPKILLADEPTGALDSKSGEQIMELFQKLNEEGVTIVMITHDPHIASNAKRMVKIIDGEIFEGDEKEDAS